MLHLLRRELLRQRLGHRGERGGGDRVQPARIREARQAVPARGGDELGVPRGRGEVARRLGHVGEGQRAHRLERERAHGGLIDAVHMSARV